VNLNSIYLTGFADEAGAPLETQIKATQELGWKNIEMRNVKVGDFSSGNLHDIPNPAFDLVVQGLEEAGLSVNCFGSAIANGAKNIKDPFDLTFKEARRAIPRMKRLGAKLIRIMSYPICRNSENQMEEERFRRLREIQAMFADEGLTAMHENCGNYGGMGWTYSLKLIENVPGLKLVYDTGNPVHDDDYTKQEPRPKQSSWEFYSHIRDHIAYIHVKDGVLEPDGNTRWCFPGEGSGDVVRILRDLLHSGYTGGISIEPHMGQGLAGPLFTPADNCFRTYVEYGRRLEKIIAQVN